MRKGHWKALTDKYGPAFLALVFLFLSYSVRGQSVYRPSNTGYFTPANKPYGLSTPVPTDGRTYKADTVNGLFRPYNGTAEVLTYLPTGSQFRVGQFPIVINVGGSLQSNGLFVGGQIQVWWFLRGQADTNLVRMDSVASGTCPACLLKANNLSDVQSLFQTLINLNLNNVDNTSDATKWAATATVTNKTFSGVNNTFTNIPNSALSNNSIGLTLNNTGTTPGVTTTPAALGTSLALSIPFGNGTNTGFIRNTDWAFFNGKLDSVHVSNDSVYNCVNGTCTLQSVIAGGTGAVLSVSNSDGSLLFSPTTGNVLGSINTAHSNTWTGQQTFNTSAPIFGTLTTNGGVFYGNGSGLLLQSVAGTSGQIFESQGSSGPIFFTPGPSTVNGWLGYTALSNALGSTHIFVGNGSNIATDVPVTGDISFNNAGLATIVRPFVDTIYRTPGKDSLQFTIGGRYHSILDSAGGGGGGAVSSVSNSDGTLTISPTTGAVVASLALGHGNTWITNPQTFNGGLALGSSVTFGTDNTYSIGSPTAVANGLYTRFLESNNILNLITNGANPIGLSPNSVTKLEVLASGQIQFNGYTTATSFTGTPLAFLGTDASGNVVQTAVSSIQTALSNTPSGGFPLFNANSSAIREIFAGTNTTIDSTTNPGGYTISSTGGGGAQTFQQTLTVGNLITKADTVQQAAHLFYFTGGGRFQVDSINIVNQVPFLNGATTLVALGNSYMAGSNRGSPDTTFYTRIINNTGLTGTNYAVSSMGIFRSDSVFDYHINPSSPATNASTTVVMVGLNDFRRGGFAPPTVRKVMNGYNVLFINQFMKNWVAAGATATGLTRYGTSWNIGFTGATLGGKTNNGAYTNHATDSITYAFTDSTVFFTTIGTDSSYGAGNYSENFSVYIDNVLKGTYSECNQADGITDGVYDNKRTPMGFFYTGLTFGSHTLKIINNTAHSYYMVIDAIGSLQPKSVAATLPMAVYQIPHLTATGYATAPNLANNTVINSANNSLDSTIALWPSWAPVRIIVTNNYFGNLPGDYTTDSIHPSNQGDLELATAYFNTTAAASASPGTIVNEGTNPYWVNANGTPIPIITSASNNFIQNQLISPQSANAYINGKYVVGGISSIGSSVKLTDQPITSSVRGNGAIPFTAFYNAGAGLNNKIWEQDVDNGGDLNWNLFKDDSSAKLTFMSITRNQIATPTINWNANFTMNPTSGTAITLTPLANADAISFAGTVAGFARPLNASMSAANGIQYKASNSSNLSTAYSNIFLETKGTADTTGSPSITFSNNTSSHIFFEGLDIHDGVFKINWANISTAFTAGFYGVGTGTSLLRLDSSGRLKILPPVSGSITTDSVMVWSTLDSSFKKVSPSVFGGGSPQTWQTGLTTGSTLTTTNNVTNTGQTFTWTNGGTGLWKYSGISHDTTASFGLLGFANDSSVRAFSWAAVAAKVSPLLPTFNVFAANGLTGAGGDSIYLGGTLNQNTTINLGTNTLNLTGTGGGIINLFASLNYNYTATSDANYTVTEGVPIYYLAPGITANRTITLPTAGTSGRTIVFYNGATTSFSWSFASSVSYLDGSALTTLSPNTWYTIICVAGQWLVLNSYAKARPISYNHTVFTPTTGGTVALVNNQYNIINPSGTLATLTVNLPSSPSNNDVIYIKYTQAVTTVTYGNGTVVDGITSPISGGLVILTYDSGTTSWY